MNPMVLTMMKMLEGQKIGSYHLEKLLGVGGFGAVFRSSEVARDRVIKQLAIKIIPDSSDEKLEELEKARNLEHNHLIRSYSSGECTILNMEMLYLAMELAQESLENRLEKGKLSSVDVRNITQQVAQGLAFLHSQNMTHRDLKPGNILWISNQWKLSDFGLLKKINTGSYAHTSNPIGTIAYMPPEAFDGNVSPAFDMWSLGIMLVQMTAGNLPYQFNDPTQLLKQVMFCNLQIPPLPKEFEAIILGCLHKDRKQRMSAQQVLNALESNNIKLQTAKANYTKLNQLLADKNWQDADIETGKVMCKIMGREEEGLLDYDSCKNFPKDELKIIDQLWVKHSNGYYGFSVQKEIWTSAKIGGKVGKYDSDKFKKLGDEVGWRKGGNWGLARK